MKVLAVRNLITYARILPAYVTVHRIVFNGLLQGILRQLPATIAALTLPIRLCSAVILAALIVGHTAKLVYGSYVYVYAVNSFCTFMLHPEPRDRLIPVSVLYVGINSESIKVGFPAFHVNK